MIQELCLHAASTSGTTFSNLVMYGKKRTSTTMQKENAKFIKTVSKLICTNRFENRFYSRAPATDFIMSEYVHNNRQ